ncbi:MAG: hypothetical protein WCQ72_03325 [Eubacteriales bacterium]
MTVDREFITVNGHVNLREFYENLGFSDVGKIRDLKKSVKYVAKYIHKQFGMVNSIREIFPFAHLLLHSRGLRTCLQLELVGDVRHLLRDVQEWLGHSDIETTSNIYLHYSRERKILVGKGIQEAFSK